MNVGKILKQRRTELGRSRLGLAKEAGISDLRLKQIENTDSNPTIQVVSRLADALGMKVEILLKQYDQEIE